MNNNEPDTLPDPAIGYIFQNDGDDANLLI
ncbi:Uncharacterised protein [Escherichia coli]|nr:Uncharacterised protein [Escherichia coli]